MQLKAIHHVTFAVTDLDRQEAFAHDFGLVTAERTDSRLVMRTRGGDECAYVAVKADKDAFVGMAFEVDDVVYLDEAINSLGASGIADLDLPGGGKCVSFPDPFGNTVTLVQAPGRREPEEFYPELVHNTPFEKKRFGRSQTPRDVAPAKLWRLGHMALFVPSFAEAHAWYTENLGMIASDVYHIPGQPQVKIVGFLRLDRGDEYVDHHVLALMQDERLGCHHISFEVQDIEAQQRTHRFLGRKDYEPIWGVGRHPHGSHVFDVWRAPDGARWETFSDTDLFRQADGTNLHDISQIEMDVWSDDEPTRYFI